MSLYQLVEILYAYGCLMQVEMVVDKFYDHCHVDKVYDHRLVDNLDPISVISQVNPQSKRKTM